MTEASELVYDTWAALSYKSTVATSRSVSAIAPTWVGQENQRRLAALCVLRAYIDNVARMHIAVLSTQPLSTDADLATVLQSATDPRKNHREYGDASLLVATAVDRLLGEDVQIVVPGAGDDPPDAPEVPPEPPDPGLDANDVERRLFDVRHARWEQEANEAIDEWQAQVTTHEAATERQRWLRDWAESEQFIAKLFEESIDSVGLGDGVYVLGWSATKRRPRLTVYDPGFYFPVLTDAADEDYPGRVHIAWEYEEADGHRYVRRITWSLGPIRPRVDELGRAVVDDTGFVLLPGDQLAEDGTITRRYPWQAPDEPDSAVTCYMSDAVWEVSEANANSPDDFSAAKARYLPNEDGAVIRELDLGIDFIPVVHVPNTPASKEHWGRSLLLTVAQLLDDIQATDTDLQAASATTGVPPITLSGTRKNGGVLAVRPGEVFEVGEEGHMDVLDTSNSLDALLKYLEQLLNRLHVNSRIPNEAVGRVKASDVPSGIALVIAFGPLRSLVRVMRLTRSEKHPLLLKFVQRLAQVGRQLPAGVLPRAEVAFGSFLPSDRAAVISDVRMLYEGHVISRQTAIQMLVDEAIIAVDVAEELARCEAEDFEAAVQLLDATGDEDAVRQRLRLSGPGPRPPAPPPAPPGLPEGAPQPPAPPAPPGPPAPPQ